MAHVKRIAIALGWIVLFIAVGVALTMGLAALNPVGSDSPWSLMASSAAPALGFLAATLVVGRLLNKHAWDRMGWHNRGPWGFAGWLGRGKVLGVVMAAAAIGVSLVASGAAVQVTGGWAPWVARVLPLGAGFAAAALAEELVFRGYPLRRLADAIGPWVATVLVAGVFGAVHLGNPNATIFGTINVMLAGVWLSLAFFSPGGMGYAWGLHLGWNAGLALLFDAPVSGYRFQVPAIEYAPGPRPWLDGGTFGPEGGVVATLVSIAGICWIVRRALRKPLRHPATWLAA